MSEFLGLAYFAEVPVVLMNVQRAGPSTGMPTRTQQSDVSICAYASHGDTKQVCLYPATPKECFDFGADAFDLADDEKTPEEQAVNSSEGRRIENCLAELEKDKAQAVQSAYVEGYSYQELAEQHSVPINTMRTWLRRSLMSLRECLER